MARIRTVKPEFFKNFKLYRAEVDEGLPLRLAFEGLWTVADREGRFEWIPEQLKVDALPYDEVDFSRVLHALWTRGYIEKYAVDGADFGWIPGFPQHQVINNRERASDLPEPNENNILTRGSRVDDATVTRIKSAQAEGKGKEQVKGNGANAPTVWDVGVGLGIERGVLGKAIKQHGEEIVAGALVKVQSKRAADPKTYFLGCLPKPEPKSTMQKPGSYDS